MALRNFNLFRPESLVLFYLIFIVLVVLSFVFNLPIKKPTLLGFAVIFASFPFYIFGIKLVDDFLSKKKSPKYVPFVISALLSLFYAKVFSSFYNYSIYSSLAVSSLLFILPCAVLIYSGKKLTGSPNKALLLLYLGLIFFFITLFQIKGIPLLNTALKLKLLTSAPFGISILSFFAGYFLLLPHLKKNSHLFLTVVLSTLLFLLMAFRGPALVLLLGGIIYAYYSKKLSLKSLPVPLLFALLIIIIVGYIAMPILNPLKLLLFRAGTTHVVFDEIVQKGYPFGLTHGSFFFHGDPRIFAGNEIMGVNKNLTYTLLGSAFMDFGIIGAFLWMLFLGIILKFAYNSMQDPFMKGFYPLLFSYSIIGIESGLDPFQLLFFWMFLLLYMAKNLKGKY